MKMISSFKTNTTEKGLQYNLFYDTGQEAIASHWHKEIEIIYCQTGETEMTVNNKKRILKAGEIGVALGGDGHSYKISDNHRRTVVLFDLSMFENESFRLLENSMIRQRLETMARFSQDWGRDVERKAVQIIYKLERLKNSGKYGRTMDIFARLCDLILLFCNEVPHSEENNSRGLKYNQVKMLEGMEEVFEYIEIHYHEKITLSDAAEVMNFNPSYFARVFHKITGTTFLMYLNNYRINRARHLLVNSNKSIFEVAQSVGFTSMKSFNRVFKQITGVSPSGYRKNEEIYQMHI